ncbi:MAG: PAS domain S-box protein [Bacteroidetes bacterium]|nr:PAS domain S-box protein [Bacteroidota bacterium]
MNSSHKLNKILFDSLNYNITDSFIVIDHNGDVLSLNHKAETFLGVSEKVKNISSIFEEQSLIKLNDLIEEVFVNNSPVVQNIQLVLKNKSELNTQIIINSYKEEDELFIFCTFRQQEYKLNFKGLSNLKVQSNNFEDIVTNKSIIKEIEKIKSFYPFTFIGKEKISKEVNQFDELFWIKDINGIYILVNSKLASSLALKPSQVEGKQYQSFLPPYQVDFCSAIEKYIKDTVNCVVMEGIPFVGISDPDKFQTIEIPLSDSDNNVIAIIGIAQKIEKKIENEQFDVFYNSSINLIENFDKALAFIDTKGMIKHGSKEFCKLFSEEIIDLRNYPYEKVFPLKITERIQQFLSSSNVSEKFETTIERVSSKKIEESFNFYLNKILDEKNTNEGFSILIEETINEDNLEKLINNRGRMFEILIQNNPEPIFIYDTENLRFIEVNDSALALYGYRKDEFLQMDLTDLYSPEDIQTLLDSSNLSARMGKFNGPFKHKKKDGAYVYVEISKIGFKYNEKDAHFNIIRDVTNQLELNRKNQLFKTAFDNTNDLLFVTDNVGLITFSNQSVKQLLGYQKSEIENSSFTALVKNDDRGTINSSIFQSHLKDSVTILTELKKSDGKFVDVEINASPILNYKGDVDSFSILCKIEKKAEEAGEEKIKEVIREVVVEKTSQGEVSNVNIPDLNLLPNLFHELLTPINVILGFVQELSGDIKNPTSEQKEAADIINQNRDRLLNIMNSVIEYSNIKQNNYELVPQEIGITEVIDQLHNDFNDISNARDMEFAYGKISSSLKFESDKHKFQALISLLLKIAIHLDKEKKIYFSAYQSDDEYFVISMKDNYSTISKNMLNNFKTIFETENDSIAKDFGISRLSILLAKTLLKLLNGRFEINEIDKNKFDCGFIFSISFAKVIESKKEIEETKIEEKPSASEPVEEFNATVQEEFTPVDRKMLHELEPAPAEEEPEEKIEETPPEIIKAKPLEKTFDKLPLSSFTCLYIEDQIDSQILFKVQMKELKEIKFAVSFEEALPLLDSCHFDFIVMDINLQGEYNGLDALRIIHKMPGYENIPIVAVTAYVLPGDKEKFIAAGFNDFISKPIFREKMIDSLEKIFLLHV